MTRSTRSHHYRRDGTVARTLRPPEAFPWSGFEDNLILALDAYLGVWIATGVSQWSDQSPQGNHVTQATGSQQPGYTTFNDRPALDFVPANSQELKGSSFSGLGANSDFTVFAVAKFDSATAAQSIVELSDSPTASNRVTSLVHETNIVKSYTGLPVVQPNYAHTDVTNASVWEVIHTDGAGVTILEDGVVQASVATAVSTIAPDEIAVGNLHQFSYYLDGKIQSIIILNSNIASDRSIIRQRLGSRWGISVS